MTVAHCSYIPPNETSYFLSPTHIADRITVAHCPIMIFPNKPTHIPAASANIACRITVVYRAVIHPDEPSYIISSVHTYIYHPNILHCSYVVSEQSQFSTE